jgi:hypothetical protein
MLYCPDVSRAKVKTNMRRVLPLFLLAAALPAFADIEANLTRPIAGPGLDVWAVQPDHTFQAGTFSGSGYYVTLSTLDPDQGAVQGDSGVHAIPVAGGILVAGKMENTYLTGGFDSSTLTPESGASGRYFSTGNTGTIDIHFYASQQSVALLWGSIDTTNSLTLSSGVQSLIVTGTQVQNAFSQFTHINGDQNYGGSAWVQYCHR